MKRWAVYGLRLLWWVFDATEKGASLAKIVTEALIAAINDWPGGDA